MARSAIPGAEMPIEAYAAAVLAGSSSLPSATRPLDASKRTTSDHPAGSEKLYRSVLSSIGVHDIPARERTTDETCSYQAADWECCATRDSVWVRSKESCWPTASESCHIREKGYTHIIHIHTHIYVHL